MHFLLVDDHALIVQALSLLLKTRFPDADVYTGGTCAEARELVREHGESCDLMILDLNLPDAESPTALLEEFAQTCPALKILVLSGLTDQQSIVRTLQLGAAGFVPKTLDADMLTNAVEFVLKGGVYIPAQLLTESQKAGILTAAVPAHAPREPDVHLTERQTEVLAALARGLPIKRICRELNLSEGTVKTHVSAIYRAFGARNRTEALIAARHAGYDILL